MAHPDVLQVPADVSDAMRSTTMAQTRPPVALTPPMSNTPMDEDTVFVCSVPFASMHRTDGKKLPFVRGYLKTKIAEDINFLLNEIKAGNPYIKLGNEDDIVQAELVYNPMAAVEHRVKKNLEAEIRAELEAKIRKEMGAGPAPGTVAASNLDAQKLAGVDGGQANANTVIVPRLNPVSSSDINTAANGGTSTDVASAVAARLAALKQ